MTQNTTAELLEGAADYIEKHGLHKGWYWKGFDADSDELTTNERASLLLEEGKTPPCCTIGAIAMTTVRTGGNTRSVFIDGELHRALEAAGVAWAEVPDWNDKPSQRKSRVVATLRKAADFARKENK